MADHPYRNEATQSEKREVLRDTYLSRAQADADQIGGRFKKVAETRVTGVPTYPSLPANSPWSQGFDQNVEPPLGFAVDEMPANEIPPTLNSPEVHAALASVEDHVGEPVGIPPLMPTGSSIKRRAWS
jgi:hypothetical protein